MFRRSARTARPAGLRSRRRVTRLGLLAAGALAISLAPGATADEILPGISPSGLTSSNVEHLKFVPFEVGTATGARVVGHFLFVTSWKSFSIYDIKDPLNPELLSQTPIGFMFENEDVSTDGRILLFSESVPGDALHVWDLQSYSQPVEVATLQGAGNHTTSCLFHCQYGWGSSGTVTDLRRIDQPKIIGDWLKGLPGKSTHDVTEIVPGKVLTSSQPFMLLDTTKSVTKPTLLATGSNPDKRFIHSILWPRAGRDRFILAGGETNFTVRCGEYNGRFMVWDTTNWKKTKKFVMTDDLQYKNGIYLDGNPALNGMGCSSHWFQAQPQFKDGGVVAVASYEHGTKFMMVSRAGKLKEVGHFIPMPGSQSAAYWITNDIVYTIDYARGFDILRYKGPITPEQVAK